MSDAVDSIGKYIHLYRYAASIESRLATSALSHFASSPARSVTRIPLLLQASKPARVARQGERQKLAMARFLNKECMRARTHICVSTYKTKKESTYVASLFVCLAICTPTLYITVYSHSHTHLPTLTPHWACTCHCPKGPKLPQPL